MAFSPSLNARSLVLLAASLVALFLSPSDTSASSSTAVPASTGSSGGNSPLNSFFCVLLDGLPGTVDFPWSLAFHFPLTYNPVPFLSGNRTTFGASVPSNATRVFTNRFGWTTSSNLPISYLALQLPIGGGIPSFLFEIFEVSPPLQLPGAGGTTLVDGLYLFGVINGVLGETGRGSSGGATTAPFDPQAQVYLSSIPGFVNTTIPPSNVNSLAVDYAACRAPITFTNGLRAPTQPSASNSARRYLYNYTVSDGGTYSISSSLTLTMSSPFASSVDLLGSPYQQVVDVSGTRVFTNPTTGELTVQKVTGLAPKVPNPSLAYLNSFYPYALLSSAPGVYSLDTAPFWDADGLFFYIQPAPYSWAWSVKLSVPPLVFSLPNPSSTPPGLTDAFWFFTDLPEGESFAYPTPLLALQRQSLTLL